MRSHAETLIWAYKVTKGERVGGEGENGRREPSRWWKKLKGPHGDLGGKTKRVRRMGECLAGDEMKSSVSNYKSVDNNIMPVGFPIVARLVEINDAMETTANEHTRGDG